MHNISHTEENYIKAIFKISEKENKAASTNAISHEMETSAASVTDIIKRLSKKGLINHEPYKGVTLTEVGNKLATNLIRKHRLWEVFLVEKLLFSWDEVHEIAEQLEHIQSDNLINRLDDFLGNPKFDPHGDPIPDADGNFTHRIQILLSEMELNKTGVLVGVQEHSTTFLQYLNRLELVLGATVKVLEKFEYDESVSVLLNNKTKMLLSHKVCQNLFVQQQPT